MAEFTMRDKGTPKDVCGEAIFIMVLKHCLLSTTDISNNVIIAVESSFCRHHEVFLSLNDYSLVT